VNRVVIFHWELGCTFADKEMPHSGNCAFHSFSVREDHFVEVFVLVAVAKLKNFHSLLGNHCNCCHMKEEGVLTQC
jgi:hypothetical protein